jgi:redox-sensing transcriptional repressor
VALFDNDRRKIGTEIVDSQLVVRDVENLGRVIDELSIDVMVIAVPAKAAQRVLNQIMSAGIKAVLNFAPVSLQSRRGVKVKTVDLTTHMESLSYFLARPSNTAVTNPKGARNRRETSEQEEQQRI